MNKLLILSALCLSVLAGCKSDKVDPAPTGIGYVDLYSEAGGRFTLATADTFLYPRIVNHTSPAIIVWMPGYHAVSADSLTVLNITLPYRPRQTQDFLLDSSTTVSFYRYLKKDNGSYLGPANYGHQGDTVHVAVQPDGKKVISFKNLIDKEVASIHYDANHVPTDSTFFTYSLSGSFTVK